LTHWSWICQYSPRIGAEKKRRVAVKATHVQIRGNWVREVGNTDRNGAVLGGWTGLPAGMP